MNRIIHPYKKKASPTLDQALFYKPIWQQSSSIAVGRDAPMPDLLFFFGVPSADFRQRFRQSRIIEVSVGDHFKQVSDTDFEIRANHKEDIERLLAGFESQSPLFVFAWSMASARLSFEEQLDLGPNSFFLLTQTLLANKKIRRAQLFYLFEGNKTEIEPIHAGLSGFTKTLALENPNFSAKVIALAGKELATVCQREFIAPPCPDLICHQEGKWVQRLELVSRKPPSTPIQLKEEGVYLLIGGAGGLGLIFAEYLAKKKAATFVLVGRSPLSSEKKEQLKQIALNTGAQLSYLQADISHRKAVGQLINQVHSKHGNINGIIHAAGVLKDSFLLKKNQTDWNQVLATKVNSTHYLTDFLKNDPLDFFLLFSSIAAMTGSVGQADYAYANGFMNAFALQQAYLQGAGATKYLAINWPFWEGGGMQLPQAQLIAMKKMANVSPLTKAEGTLALEQAINLKTPVLLFIKGIQNKIEQMIYPKSTDTSKISNGTSGNELKEKAMQYFKELLAAEIKLPASKIKASAPLEKYGIDSMMIMSLTQKMEAAFGQLSKTLFFEHQTLGELVDYFVEHHQKELLPLLNMQAVAPPSSPKVKTVENKKKPFRKFQFRKNQTALEKPTPIEKIRAARIPEEKSPQVEEVAIIGVSGRYPQANDLETFWDNLKSGKDCITEIPDERWNWRADFVPEKGKAGKYYSKWGGFIDDVDKFDPIFFNMSPLEAQLIDPQERLFLETTWHTLENASYSKTQLSGKKIGVFVGVMYGQYQLYNETEEGFVPSSSFASIANRISYYFNFFGPSLAVDTMCSSSLTAIHLACNSILAGESEMAVAGGVNVSVHPHKYKLLSQSQFASTDGRCHSFGEGGDGYVPGEGVGAVLLKPLSKAIADKDHIYAVIKGSALNHGGKTNGYTVPNPKAQAKVIKTALDETKFPKETIGYVEAHGTGTSLGDPIEIAGLNNAFGTKGKKSSVPIGSVKSNIGHLESAAGIAAITKVLLQMKHRQLVPSIHSHIQNPNLQLEDSTFFIQKKLAEWPTLYAAENKEEKLPLRAGVSSFGAGGANAHIILEAYPVPDLTTPLASGPQLIPLSAKSEEQLKENAKKLLQYLERNAAEASTEGQSIEEIIRQLKSFITQIFEIEEEHIDVEEELMSLGFSPVFMASFTQKVNSFFQLQLSDAVLNEANNLKKIAGNIGQLLGPKGKIGQAINLQDFAYTLQAGREAFPYRLIFTSENIPQTIDKLRHFLADDATTLPELTIHKSDDGEDVTADAIRIFTKNKDFESLARLWATGTAFDWKLLHNDQIPQRLPLPGYSFVRERCWLKTKQNQPITAIIMEQNIENSPTNNTRATVIPEQEIPVAPKQNPKPQEELSIKVLTKMLVKDIRKEAAEIIRLDPKRLDPKENLGNYGFESMNFVKLSENLNATYKVETTPAIFFDKGSVNGLAEHLIETYKDALLVHYSVTKEKEPAMITTPVGKTATAPQTARTTTKVAEVAQDDVAIIGISGRFPGTHDLAEWWQQLENEVDLISEVPAERWDWKKYHVDHATGPHKTRSLWGGFIPDADKFDAAFFNISPSEAEMMDPQQRIFLETVWHTIENAGYKASEFSGKKLGIFSGVQFNDYQYLLANNGELNPHMGLGNEHSILVNRASFLLNSHGPSEPYNTACSSALVAIHRAIDSIKTGESEVALAGGVTLMLDPMVTISADNLGILSPDGRCKTLDANANGYVRGEGVGLVMLKPLSKAKKDGDHIYGVIRGSAVNHGGKASSLTAPNSQAQAELLVEAYGQAGFSPETISHLELHGTGTKLGDPVEIQGITTAFNRLAAKENRNLGLEKTCGISSIKTNIGHLEPAAGIAGLLKLVLSIGHKKLPGHLHLKEQNPYIKLDNSPFYIIDKTKDWAQLKDEKGNPIPRRAGVSSFGFGGVNAHVVLEEYAQERLSESNKTLAFVLSAKTEERLQAYAQSMLQFLDDRAAGKLIYSPSLDEIAYTLQVGREDLTYRWACCASSVEEFRQFLSDFIQEKSSSSYLTGKEKPFEDAVEIDEEELENVLESGNLGKLIAYWIDGTAIDWAQLYVSNKRPNRAPIPVYPFEKRRHWFTPKPESALQLATPNVAMVGEVIRDKYGFVLEFLKDTVQAKLEVDTLEVNEKTNFNDIGVDSIMSSFIMQIVQERFSNEIPLTALMEYPILGDLAQYIADEFLPEDFVSYSSGATGGRAQNRENRLPPEVLPINVKGTKQTSFWIHGATGFSTFFKDLSNILGPDYPMYAFQARGTDGISMPQTFEEMVTHYIDCIKMIQAEGPYFIGGYSFGGLVAYEIARRLHEQGDKIAHLAMLEAFPTTGTVNEKFYETYDFDFLKLYLVNAFLKSGENKHLIITKEDLDGVPDSMKVGHLAKLAKEKAKLIIPVDDVYNYIKGGLICSDYAEGAYKSVQVDKPYNGSDVLYFRTTKGFIGEGNLLNWDSLDIYALYDYISPWRELVKKDMEVVSIESDHFSILEEPTLSVVAAKVEEALNKPQPKDLEDYAIFKQQFGEVNNFICYPVLKAFQQEGIFLKKGEKKTAEAIKKQIGVVDDYHKLADELIEMMVRNNFVERKGRQLIGTGNINSAETKKELAGLTDKLDKFAQEYKAVDNYLPLLNSCQNDFMKVLKGEIPGTEVLIPKGSTHLIEPIYTGNFQMDHYSGLVATAVKTYIKDKLRRYPNSRINILEVGAGTGSTSKIVFDAIGEYSKKISYFYTDIAPVFLQMAKQQFLGENPYIDFTVLDINKTHSTQGFEPGSIDIVLGSNVLHTCKLIEPVLRHIQEVLRPNGLILINELTQRLDYNTLTFGLLQDWWHFEDEKLRIKGAPLFSNEKWCKLLEKNGFADCEIRGLDTAVPQDMAQSLIFGKKK